MTGLASARRALLLLALGAPVVACSALLGLDDLHDRAEIPDACGATCDGGTDSAQSSDAPAGDAAVDAEAGDPCDFQKVTDPKVTANPDYAGWRMPNLGGVNATQYRLLDAGTVDAVHDDITNLDWERVPTPGLSSLAEAAAHCSSLTSDTALPWRLPTRIELVSIQLYKNMVNDVFPPPCIDESKFDMGTDTHALNYVTSTLKPGGPKSWVVYFLTCGAKTIEVAANAWARCVRGAPSVPDFRVSTRCNVVRDMNTRLEWQRDIGMVSPIRVDDDAGTTLMNNAANYCAGLGAAKAKDFPLMGGGWVVPTQNELYTTFDTSRTTPPLVSDALFAATPTGGKIISSSFSRTSSIYGGLNLDTGEETGALFNESVALRCVRHF